jgi:hypothetical protein
MIWNCSGDGGDDGEAMDSGSDQEPRGLNQTSRSGGPIPDGIRAGAPIRLRDHRAPGTARHHASPDVQKTEAIVYGAPE